MHRSLAQALLANGIQATDPDMVPSRVSRIAAEMRKKLNLMPNSCLAGAPILFWLMTILLILMVLAALLRPLLWPAGKPARLADSDMQVYRDQLAEVETDLARGVISASEAASSRTEVSRRMLKSAETAPLPSGPQPNLGFGLPIILASSAFAALAFGLYLQLGSPNLPDLPLGRRLADLAAQRALRPSQAEAEQAFAAVSAADPGRSAPNARDKNLIEQLNQTLASRPNDLRGHELLAQTQSQVGLWAAARLSQEKVLRIKGDTAQGTDYLLLGQYMVLAAGGFVSPEAEQAIANGLTREPASPMGRYFSGLALAQGGRPDLAYRLWAGLVAEGPGDSPWVVAATAGLPDAAAASGLPVPEPDALPGPDAGSIAAAEEMNEADRNAMIAAMVETLANRLGSTGGTLQEWTQLIRSYGVLGETAKAAAAWQTAKAAFAGQSAAQQSLLQAAQAAGVAN